MSYTARFRHADDIIRHLDTVVPSLADPLLKAKYVGFVAVSGVTVYELAIKDIFVAFGTKKHKVLGTFTESYFKKINGRIKIDDLRSQYIVRFGPKYRKRFDDLLQRSAQVFLVTHKRDIITSYSNLITWRNDFAHEGQIKSTATYSEAVQAYVDGKEVIHCLASSMVR